MELELELQRSLEPPPGSPGEGEGPQWRGLGDGCLCFPAGVLGRASDFLPSPTPLGCVCEEPGSKGGVLTSSLILSTPARSSPLAAR